MVSVSSIVRRLLWFLLLAPLVAAAFAAPATEILPVEALKAGMKGYGLSDFGDGRGIQRFDVEVVGTLRNFAAKQDLILARVFGAGLDQAGVVAGMSGSPVYVEGKLIGAVAYGWPFSRDPIAGITPIQSMLDIRHAPPVPPTPIGGSSATRAFLSAFGSGEFSVPFDALLSGLRPPSASGWTALPLPLSAAGATLRSGGLLSRVVDQAGWIAVPSGASPIADRPSPIADRRLQPGSAVATILLDGDMTLAATGTVTWVEGNNVLAFGHPFLSMGPVEMPMARSRVLTVLRSLFRSFKFTTTEDVLGSITQDRSTGILGSFGSQATMIPVAVRIRSEDIPEQKYRFRVVQNSMLTPILTAIAVDNVLTTLQKSAGERTIVWKSSIETGDRTVRWETVFSGLAANREAVGSLALLTNFLMANEFRALDIHSIDVWMSHSDTLASARVTNVEADKDRVRPGETIPVHVNLQDFRKGSRALTIDLPIPAETPPGPLTVFVGDGAAATSYDLSLFPPDPRSLEQVLDFLARIRPANTVNVFAYRKASGAVVGGEPLPALPPSVASLVVGRGPADGTPDLHYARIFQKTVEQPVPVQGSVKFQLNVVPKID